MRLTRHFACIVAACAFGAAHAQTFPSKPIKVVIPFAAGATTDVLVRVVGAKMTEDWGVPIIADNRPGAGGMIGSEIVAKSAPDGYTLVSVISSHLLHPELNHATFDPIKDFSPIAMQGRTPNIICVHPSLPARSIKELIALARARPGELTHGAAATGGSNHLTAELFKMAAKIDVRYIPYKGGAPNAAAVASGEIPMTVSLMPTIAPFVKAGRVRALAISSATRHPSMPDVPTLIESGFPGFESYEWWALLGPAGMSKDMVAKLNGEIERAMSVPEIRNRIANVGVDFTSSTPEQTEAYMRSERERWVKVVKAAGLKGQ